MPCNLWMALFRCWGQLHTRFQATYLTSDIKPWKANFYHTLLLLLSLSVLYCMCNCGRGVTCREWLQLVTLKWRRHASRGKKGGTLRLQGLSWKTRIPLNLFLLSHGFALAWGCVIDTHSMRLAVKHINSLQIILSVPSNTIYSENAITSHYLVLF